MCKRFRTSNNNIVRFLGTRNMGVLRNSCASLLNNTYETSFCFIDSKPFGFVKNVVHAYYYGALSADQLYTANLVNLLLQRRRTLLSDSLIKFLTRPSFLS